MAELLAVDAETLIDVRKHALEIARVRTVPSEASRNPGFELAMERALRVEQWLLRPKGSRSGV